MNERREGETVEVKKKEEKKKKKKRKEDEKARARSLARLAPVILFNL